MNQTQWDEKLKSFLKKTGEDVKRAGNDIKSEAEKLLKEVKDPERQAKLKAGMKDFGGWARKTAEEMAELMETGVKKAEQALGKATDKVADFAGNPRPAADPAPRSPPPQPPASPAQAAKATAPSAGKAAKKSIGGSRRKGPARKAAAKKSIGKPPPPGEDADP